MIPFLWDLNHTFLIFYLRQPQLLIIHPQLIFSGIFVLRETKCQEKRLAEDLVSPSFPD